MLLPIFAATWLFFQGNISASAPYLPTDDSQPLEQLPVVGNRELRGLRALHAELAKHPDDLALAVKVATKDIEAARSMSDPRYNGYAEAAIAPWLSRPNPPVQALLLRAILRQAIHNFQGAMDDLDAVISSDPRNLQARLTRAVILEVQGHYAESLKACLSLAILADDVITTTCAASVNSLGGQAKESQAALMAALNRARGDEDPQLLLWALTVLAEIENRIGDDASAEQHFRRALAVGTHDAYLLGAYADFLLDAGRADEVRSLLQGELRVDPLLLRLALAEKMLGSAELAKHVDDLRERFSVNKLRGDKSHQREEARFTLHLLGDVTEALRIAQENFGVQREPMDARILLEAAIAADMPAAAQPVLDFLQASGLEDAHLQRLASQMTRAER
ncbi:MAG TPA: hypothetical protein VEK34_13850 [Methylocella sp.]|nr:hypothetical protein [Methylocella sp.]